MSVEIELHFRNSKWENLTEKTFQNQTNLEDKISEQIFNLAQSLKADECEKSESNTVRVSRGEAELEHDSLVSYTTEHYPFDSFRMCRTQYLKYRVLVHSTNEENDNVKNTMFVEILKLNPQPHSVQINDK